MWLRLYKNILIALMIFLDSKSLASSAFKKHNIADGLNIVLQFLYEEHMTLYENFRSEVPTLKRCH